MSLRAIPLLLLLGCFITAAFAVDSSSFSSRSGVSTAAYRQSYVLYDRYEYWLALDASDWPRCPLYQWYLPGCASGFTPKITFTVVDTTPYVWCGSCLVGDLDNVKIDMTIPSYSTSYTMVQFCGHVFFESGHGNSTYMSIHYTVTCTSNSY